MVDVEKTHLGISYHQVIPRTTELYQNSIRKRMSKLIVLFYTKYYKKLSRINLTEPKILPGVKTRYYLTRL
ncbi:hypothetical protein NUACC21_53680 [Scytonema sp. NUACC21]